MSWLRRIINHDCKEPIVIDIKYFETLKDTDHIDIFLSGVIVTLDKVDSKELIRLAKLGLEYENAQ